MSKSTFDKAITPMQAARVLYRMNATEIPEAKLQQMATKRRGAVLALRRKQAELEKVARAVAGGGYANTVTGLEPLIETIRQNTPTERLPYVTAVRQCQSIADLGGKFTLVRDRNTTNLKLDMEIGPYDLEYDDNTVVAGPFNLHMSLCWENKTLYDTIVTADPVADAKTTNDGYCHPHIQHTGRGICFGDAQRIFFDSFKSGRLADAVQVLTHMLSGFHEEGMYIQIFREMLGHRECRYTGKTFEDDGTTSKRGFQVHPDERVYTSLHDTTYEYKDDIIKTQMDLFADGSPTTLLTSRFDPTADTQDGVSRPANLIVRTGATNRAIFIEHAGICEVTGMTCRKILPEGDTYRVRYPDDCIVIPGIGNVSVAALPYIPRTQEAHNVRINCHRSIKAIERIERVWPDSEGNVRDEYCFRSKAPVLQAVGEAQDGADVAGVPEDATAGAEG
jgi:hypothetical protein